MPLLNYTTKVTTAKTVAEMQDALVQAGASSVSGSYRDGHPVGLTFTIDTAHGIRTFTLPVDPLPVQAILKADPEVRAAARPSRPYDSLEHAERVAWRILKDWMEAQLALIATQMVTLDQVMLPYMVTDELGTTVWDAYQANALRALPAG